MPDVTAKNDPLTEQSLILAILAGALAKLLDDDDFYTDLQPPQITFKSPFSDRRYRIELIEEKD